MYESPTIKEIGSVRDITLGDTWNLERQDQHYEFTLEGWRNIASF